MVVGTPCIITATILKGTRQASASVGINPRAASVPTGQVRALLAAAIFVNCQQLMSNRA